MLKNKFSCSLKQWSIVKMKRTQSCWTLCDPMDCILWARILEWVTFPFSRGSSQPLDWTQVSHIASRFFTSWATMEVLINLITSFLKIKFLNGTLLHTCLLTLPNGKSHLIHRSTSVRNRKNINPLWGMKIQIKHYYRVSWTNLCELCGAFYRPTLNSVF